MKLNVLERITLMGILPPESNFITFRLITDFKKELSFTEKEIKTCGITQQDGKVFWKKSIDKNFTIGEQLLIIIQTSLQKLDKEGKVNDNNISLFDKFQPKIEVETKKE
jgi:hypothetical protein